MKVKHFFLYYFLLSSPCGGNFLLAEPFACAPVIVSIDMQIINVVNVADRTAIGFPFSGLSTPAAVAVTPNPIVSPLFPNNFLSYVPLSSREVFVGNVTQQTTPSSAYAAFVGTNPSDVAVTPPIGGVNFAYVTNSSDNNVSIIDSVENTVLGFTIAVGNNPQAIAISPSIGGVYFAYVANFNDNTVSVINTTTNTVVGAPIAVGTGPTAVAISPPLPSSGHAFAYVANVTDSTVSVIDTSMNLVVATVSVPNPPLSIAVTPTFDGTTLKGIFAYVASDSAVSVIDTATNAVVGSPIATLSTTTAIATTPSANGVVAYVVSDAGTTTVIDTSTNTVIDSFIMGTGTVDVAFTPFPFPPTSLVGSQPTTNDNHLSWTASFSTNVANYNIYRNGTLLATVSGSTTSYDDLDVAFEATYAVTALMPGATQINESVLSNAVTLSPFVPPPPPPLGPLPPSHLAGQQINNRYLKQSDLVNVLNWQASPTSNVTGYNIRRNGELITTVPATGPLVYRDHNRRLGVQTAYIVTAVNGSGESLPIAVIIP